MNATALEIAPPAPTPSVPRSPGFWRYAARGAGWAVAALLLTVLALATVVPLAIGGTALTVLSGSMRPALEAGDLIVIRPTSATDIRIGDIVAYHPISGDPTLITHRVVGKSVVAGQPAGFLTRGDANGATDAPVQAEQVAGTLVYSIPKLGYVSSFVATHRPALLVGVAAVLVFVAIGYGVDLIRRKRAERGAS